ncbi:hypothetical protein [Pseudomonas entomophila]|uniref:hypothetical protein n=1 Tax=Pseudomonas entomophila TaxID=312306 RepID=UPI001F02835F|nr:hypothetical protein [Pseudomonas entomophila]MCG8291423.1 hypothetical protein [Pseudomonas entomophila]
MKISETELYRSLVHNGENPQACTGARKYLAEQTNHGRQPFTDAIAYVNRNLASWGNGGLPMQKARAYANDVRRVEGGEISNTTAFILSAIGWAKEGNAVGVAMNCLGALASGPVDHQNYIFGRAGGSLRNPANTGGR